MTLQTVDVDELSKERIGYIAISINGWSDSTLPTLTAGSCIEIAGSLYYATGDENLGTAGEIAGIGNNTLVYSYYNVATDLFYYSSSACVWDDAKQGWYHSVSTTHRCVLQFLKITAGTYIRKNILINRRSLYKKDYAYETDEYMYTTAASALRAIYVNTTNSVVSSHYSTKIFYLKKPVSAYIKTSFISGSTVHVTAAYKGVALHILQDNTYIVLSSGGYVGYESYPYYIYGLQLNPGKYKLIGRNRCANAGLAATMKHSLYISGAYGLSSVSSRGIIDT